jgi:hypothetical protein
MAGDVFSEQTRRTLAPAPKPPQNARMKIAIVEPTPGMRQTPRTAFADQWSSYHNRH